MVSSSPLRMRTLAWRARWRLGKTTWLALETHECETKEKVGKTACNGRATCDFSHFTSAGFSKIFHSVFITRGSQNVSIQQQIQLAWPTPPLKENALVQ